MRVFALELNNDILGIRERKEYIGNLIAKLPAPDLVVLPELSLCGYIPNRDIWSLADDGGRDAAAWAVAASKSSGAFICAGYADREGGHYYNRYLIAGPEGVFGSVSKSEAEAAVFRRGGYGSVIDTPFGKVGVGICYDSRRRHFYENVKDESLSMILFPHASPADPKKTRNEQRENDLRCTLYADAFGVPVVYVNSCGAVSRMPGRMGAMMAKHGFRLNGLSRIYDPAASPLDAGIPEAVGAEVKIHSKRKVKDLVFYGEDILPGNGLFRRFVLKGDVEAGIREYEKARQTGSEPA